MTTTCNSCGEVFEVTPRSIIEAEFIREHEEDLTVQYFKCPKCGRKYVVFAANEEMKRLVDERVAIQKKVKAAHIGKFREKTTRQYLNEIAKIEEKQKKLLQTLKPRAERLLAEEDA